MRLRPLCVKEQRIYVCCLKVRLSTAIGFYFRNITCHLFKKFPEFCGTQLITTFTRTAYWPQSWATLMQSTIPNPISLRCILHLSFHPLVHTSSKYLGITSKLQTPQCWYKSGATLTTHRYWGATLPNVVTITILSPRFRRSCVNLCLDLPKGFFLSYFYTTNVPWHALLPCVLYIPPVSSALYVSTYHFDF
jgi:hypothetical protein